MTQFDPDSGQRRSVRLKGWNYSWIGGYSVVLCVEDRECIFGDIVGGEMRLSDLGMIVVEEWVRTPILRPQVELDQWVIMPNHLHGVVMIVNRGGLSTDGPELGAPMMFTGADATARPQGDQQVAPTNDSDKARGPERGSIGAIIGGFKAASMKRINLLRGTPGAKVWQRSFYDHVIRDEQDLEHARTYIFENPMNWDTDENNPLSKWED